MVTVLHPEVAIAGTAWLTLGVFVYLVYRKQQDLDLTSTHKVVVPQPVLDREAEYDSVLVALPVDEGYDEHVVATSIKLAARRRHGVHVVVMITMPYSLPASAEVRELEAAAASFIEQARIQGGRRVTGHWEKVCPGQAGRRIIEEAEEMLRPRSSWRCRAASPAPRCSGARSRRCWPTGPAGSSSSPRPTTGLSARPPIRPSAANEGRSTRVPEGTDRG